MTEGTAGISWAIGNDEPADLAVRLTEDRQSAAAEERRLARVREGGAPDWGQDERRGGLR